MINKILNNSLKKKQFNFNILEKLNKIEFINNKIFYLKKILFELRIRKKISAPFFKNLYKKIKKKIVILNFLNTKLFN